MSGGSQVQLINSSNSSVTSMEAEISSFLIRQHQLSSVFVVGTLISQEPWTTSHTQHAWFSFSMTWVYVHWVLNLVDEASDRCGFGFTCGGLLSEHWRCVCWYSVAKNQLATVLQMAAITSHSFVLCLVICQKKNIQMKLNVSMVRSQWPAPFGMTKYPGAHLTNAIWKHCLHADREWCQCPVYKWNCQKLSLVNCRYICKTTHSPLAIIEPCQNELERIISCKLQLACWKFGETGPRYTKLSH